MHALDLVVDYLGIGGCVHLGWRIFRKLNSKLINLIAMETEGGKDTSTEVVAAAVLGRSFRFSQSLALGDILIYVLWLVVAEKQKPPPSSGAVERARQRIFRKLRDKRQTDVTFGWHRNAT